MYIRTKTVYPHHVKKKAVARFLELTKDIPADPDANSFASVHYECGKVVYVGYLEVSSENLGQKLAEAMKNMMKYDDIEGFEYDIGVSYSVEDALKLAK